MSCTSARLCFIRFDVADFQRYALLAMDEGVMKYITGRALNQKEAEERFQNALYANDKNPEAGFFMVKSKFDDEFIGVAKLVLLDGNQAEVGYMLLPDHWGKGFASEMVECMIRINSDKQIAGVLIGIVDPENPASIKVLTKYGFKLFETGQIDGLPAAYYKLDVNERV